MKVSLNTVKQYTSVDLSVDELVAKINAQLGGIDEVINLAERYEGAVIAKVIECNDHPNADRLHVCKIDDGGAVKDIGRDDNGYVQVVCGAPNVKVGMFVVWLPPKSTVPSSYGEKELFVLDARELRGVMSNGMLASAKELGIGDDHDGIVEIDPTDWKPIDVKIKPGTSFAQAYGLDDIIIDIENKMFTHRPDCFGQLGVAREIAGIQHKQFTSPDWYTKTPEFASASGLELDVLNEAKDSVPRFMAVALQNVEIKSSPLWLQCELVRLGSKPINNVVDVTNYVMLLTGQPLHAYDYDKLRGHKLGVRKAVQGETLPLLNGKSYELSSDDIVIIDGEGPVGLGGVMGGGNSEVSTSTKSIVLECATFDMYTIRKTSMRHGLFTDAVTRFNKGQSSLQNAFAMQLAMKSIFDTAGGEQASDVFDQAKNEDHKLASVVIAPSFINDRLGLALSIDEISTLLKNVEFEVDQNNEELQYNAPYWRTDIELPEDIVEEVGRLYGFDKLPRELPRRSTKPAPKNKRRELAQTLRESLSRAGASEVLTYSFVHENIIKKAGQDIAEAYKLSNALSPDLQYYRLSLTPSLLDKVHANIKAGHDEFALFEIGKAHSKRADTNEDGLPAELRRLAFVYASKNATSGAPYYKAKKILDVMAATLGLTLVYKPLPADTTLTAAKPFESLRSARVIDEASGQAIGIIGEYTFGVKKNFKLPASTAGFELLPEAIEFALQHERQTYSPLSRYPSSERDICYQVPRSTAYNDVVEAMNDAIDDENIKVSIAPLDIYQPKDGDTKNVTVRLTLTAANKTLSGNEVTQVTDKLAAAVVDKLSASIV